MNHLCLVRSKCLELPNWSRNFYCQNDLKSLSNFHYLGLFIKKHTIMVNPLLTLMYFNESASTKAYLHRNGRFKFKIQRTVAILTHPFHDSPYIVSALNCFVFLR